MGFPTKIVWVVPISHTPAGRKRRAFLFRGKKKKDDVGLELENQLINDCTSRQSYLDYW
jgi:hypothetical protein